MKRRRRVRFRKGTQSGSLKVEAGTDVDEDGMGGVGVMLLGVLQEFGLLVGAVGELFAGGDTGVHDEFALRFCLFLPRWVLADVDAAVATGSGRERDLPTCGPSTDGSFADSIVGCSKRCPDVLAHPRLKYCDIF